MNYVTKEGCKHGVSKAMMRIIAIVLSLIVVFYAGYDIGVTSNIKATVEGGAVATDTQTATTPAATTPATTAPAGDTAATTAPAGDSQSTDATTAPAGDSSSDAGSSTGAPQTKAEIVAYYNTAANKIKTEASSVTRNWEDLQHNEEHLVVPSALQSIGSQLISTFLKKDETPVNYTGSQEIIDNYPVKGESYVSNAKESDVVDAQCVDNGDTYTITLKFIEETDPTSTGAATAFNVIKAQEVYDAASVVKSFTAKYYDATIVCTVDKATQRVTAATYTLPIILNVTASVLVTLDAQVGMTFIDDYTINY